MDSRSGVYCNTAIQCFPSLGVTFIQTFDESEGFSCQHLVKVLLFLVITVPESCHLFIGIIPGQLESYIRSKFCMAASVPISFLGIAPKDGSEAGGGLGLSPSV